MRKIKHKETNEVFEIYGTIESGFIVWNENLLGFVCIPFECAIPYMEIKQNDNNKSNINNKKDTYSPIIPISLPNSNSHLEENKSSVVKNNLNGYFTNTDNLRKDRNTRTIDNPIDFDYLDNQHLIDKCVHERSRREHYVSCAKSNFPVQILNCSKYCPCYKPSSQN